MQQTKAIAIQNAQAQVRQYIPAGRGFSAALIEQALIEQGREESQRE